MQKYFCAVYVYEGKAELSKGYWNPKRKFGGLVNMERKYGKKMLLELWLLNYL